MRPTLARLLALSLLLPAAAVAQVTSLDQIHFPPLRTPHVPKPERVVLSNGMEILLLEDHELPTIDAIALIRTGSRLEPTAKSGLAEITGEVLRAGGTTRMTGAEIDDFLDSRAARVESLIDEDFGRVTMDSLKADFPDVLKVFADVLRRPAFPADQVEVVKSLAMGGVSRQNYEQRDILNREFKRVVYGKDSPYSRFPTFTSISSITRQDVVAWHQTYYHPNRVILGLVGDFQRDEALKLIEAAFGDWPAGPAVKDPEPPYRKEPNPGVYFVEKNDVPQSAIIMGGPGILNSSEDFYTIEVMNRVMAGSFSSRFLSSIRTGKSLSYVVFAKVGGDWDHPGLTQMSLTTKTQSTGEGIEALLEQTREMITIPPSDAEVAKVKKAILNSFVFEYDSTRKFLNQQLVYEYNGYPPDWLSRYCGAIEAVTPEQVRAVAAKYLQPEKFSILVVGPSAGRDKPLSTYGPVTQIDITIPPPPAAKP